MWRTQQNQERARSQSTWQAMGPDKKLACFLLAEWEISSKKDLKIFEDLSCGDFR